MELKYLSCSSIWSAAVEITLSQLRYLVFQKVSIEEVNNFKLINRKIKLEGCCMKYFLKIIKKEYIPIEKKHTLQKNTIDIVLETDTAKKPINDMSRC